MDLDELERLARQATSGEWEWNPDFPNEIAVEREPFLRVSGNREAADAAYIASCSPDRVLVLVERVRAAEAAILRIAKAADEYLEARAGRGHVDDHDHDLPGHSDYEAWPPPDCGRCGGAQYGTEADLFEYAIPEAAALIPDPHDTADDEAAQRALAGKWGAG